MLAVDGFTLSETLVDVGDGHRLYVQDWGEAGAPAVLFLHGGPGTGATDDHKQCFDPSRQRVLFCDQRGVGRSEPYGSLQDNTTDHLVADIVRVLDRFEVDQAVLVGGSWSSCLALVFALAHPDRVRALVLHGLLTGRQQESDRLNQGHWRTFFPEVWQWYLDRTPREHHDDPSGYHVAQILGSDAARSRRSAYACTTADSAITDLDDRFAPAPLTDDFDPTPARVQAHCFTNSRFLPPDHVLDTTDRLTMPVHVVQGRYDMICPPRSAYELVQKLPRGELVRAVSGHGPDRESWNLLRTLLLELTR
ncbi:alpha/beta fold hydrolase [Kineococcus sp. SYSU DK006]|uniref:alpha/beta fold hydrolase n=1 Tax=Kineococcus sp. SYSU DK006 TaxID=3383127 RepID=UPI003D7CEBD1